jgi:hypothetical protein
MLRLTPNSPMPPVAPRAPVSSPYPVVRVRFGPGPIGLPIALPHTRSRKSRGRQRQDER